jgi:chromosome segregation ATPase
MADAEHLDFPTAVSKWAAMDAHLRAFTDIGAVLQAAAEAETFIKAAPEQRTKLEGELAALKTAVESEGARLNAAKEQNARLAVELDSAKKDIERQRTHLEAEYARKVAELDADYREKDVKFQETHDQRRAELDAELAALERQIREAKQLRDRLKAL